MALAALSRMGATLADYWTPKATVIWWRPDPIVARIPVAEAKRLPAGSRKTADNSGVKKWTAIGTALVLGVVSLLFSMGLFIVSIPHLSMWTVTWMVIIPVVAILTGFLVGWTKVAPLFYLDPIYIFEGSKEDALAPVKPDHWLDEQWPAYFAAVNQAIAAEIGQDKADTLIDPKKSKMVTARFDASSMAYLECMENEAMDMRAGISKAAMMQMAITGGVIFFAFLGFMVFTIVVADL